MTRSTGRGAVLCLMSAAGFGLAPVFARPGYGAGTTVATMLTGRFALAAVLLWALVAWRRPARPPARLLAGCVVLGGVGYALQAVLFFAALARMSAALVSLLVYVYPALVTVLAVVLRRERAGRRRVAALATSAGGLVLLLAAGPVGAADPAGVTLALGTAATYAIYLTATDGLPRDLDVVLLAAVVCTAAAGSIAGWGLVTGTLTAPARPGGWMWIAVLAAVSTVLPLVCLLGGIRAVGAPTAAVLSTAEPAVTVSAVALLYGERLTPAQLVGAAAVLAAVVVLQLPGRRRTVRVGAADEPAIGRAEPAHM